MIDIDSIEILIEQYAKHDWTPRRILLRADTFTAIESNLPVELKSLDIRVGAIDAIWFSRANKDAESWELRLLGGPPYALVRFVPNGASNDEREAILSEAEFEVETNSPTPTEH